MASDRDIARERIAVLRQAAEDAAKAGRLDRADRYAELIRRLGMRYNVSLPDDVKPFVCTECSGFLLPGRTSRVRTREMRVVTTCLRCGATHRHPFREEVGRRRRP